jgi:hypothetical protein
MIKLVANGGWLPMDDAPRDGSWIIGFCGDARGEAIYTVMRWWDGIIPDDDDDLSTEEEGGWVGPDDRAIRRSTAWLPFDPHPNAPPPTVSFDDYDGGLGIKYLSRAERGITQADIDATRAVYAQFEAEQEARLAREEEDEWIGQTMDEDPTPGGEAA